MIVSRLFGGLGNQMFQYAAGRSKAIALGTNLVLDATAFQTYTLHPYSIKRFSLQSTELQPPQYAARPVRFGGSWWKRLLGQGGPPLKLVRERGLRWQPLLNDAPDHSFLVGYWQTEQYFAGIRSELLTELQLPSVATGRDAEVIAQMNDSTSVAVHIRRGDYVSDASTNQVHGTCDSEYYRRAVMRLVDQFGSLRLFVFSDDPKWCRENLNLGQPTIFVDHNDEKRNCEDLRLMSHANHFIIANSSFSWWGAWLSQQADKVVFAPARWFQTDRNDDSDIVPHSWIRI